MNLELKVTDFDSLKDEHKAIVDPSQTQFFLRRMYSLPEDCRGPGPPPSSRTSSACQWKGCHGITRSEGAPYMLNIRGSDLSISIDLVPSIHSASSSPINGRIAQGSRRSRGLWGIAPTSVIMAICLWKADSERFEIDFHDLERKVSTTRDA